MVLEEKVHTVYMYEKLSFLSTEIFQECLFRGAVHFVLGLSSCSEADEVEVMMQSVPSFGSYRKSGEGRA